MLEARLVQAKDVQSPTGPLPVAWVQVAGWKDVGVPLARLAEVLDYDLKALRSLVQRDPVLRDFERVVTTFSGNLKRSQTYLLRPGVLGRVGLKSPPTASKTPPSAERVIQFQRWAFETLDRLLFEEPHRAPEPQPLFPGLPRRYTKGDRALALAMLAGEVRAPDGRLYSYQAIERLSGVPRTTVIRLAHRHGWGALGDESAHCAATANPAAAQQRTAQPACPAGAGVAAYAEEHGPLAKPAMNC
ncbi:MAG: hypothetical protein KatS3mg071_0383 [Meiothermus sp.]|nr:MAG: hypothetical protein KatS3mg071_0383 [Meiothermus sp.]